MRFFLPDQDSLRDLFGPYMDRGLQFYIEEDEPLGHALEIRFLPGSNGIPVYPLDMRRLQTADDAEQYFKELRDTEVVKVCGPMQGT